MVTFSIIKWGYSLLSRIIIGVNFLVHNIYNLVVGKECHFNMWFSIFIFSIVFISGFSYMLKKGQIYLLMIKTAVIIISATIAGSVRGLFCC